MSRPPDPLTDGTRDAWTPSGEHRVYGLPVDDQTRCVHYFGPTDVIGIRFRCCDRIYPCHACHDAVADHPSTVWAPSERDADALLCGACGSTLTIQRYLEVERCPTCASTFNPGCRLHHHLYFA